MIPFYFEEALVAALEGLDEVLSVIAYDDKSEDPTYIKKAKRQTRGDYERLVIFLEEEHHSSGRGEAVIAAYRGLQDLDVTGSPSTVQEEAEEVLQTEIIPFLNPLERQDS